MAFQFLKIGLASLATLSLATAFACGESSPENNDDPSLDAGFVVDDAGQGGDEHDAAVELDASVELDAAVEEDASVVEESDEEFCARHHAQCGVLTANDLVGAQRTVENCGNCEAPERCDEETHTCGCQAKTCEDEQMICGENDDGCGGTITCSDPCIPVESLRIRLMAGNLTSRINGSAKQSYDGGHGIRIFQGLKPDIAFVQEFNYGDNTPDALQAMVTEAFGSQFHFVYQPRDQQVNIPNAVVSAYPIVDWGVFTDPTVEERGHVWAHIDLPGPSDLWAVSVHIPTHGTKRQESIGQLMKDLDTLNIPSEDYVAIGGDFNTTSRRDDHGLRLLDDTGLVVLDTDKDCPIDQDDNDNTNINRSKDYDAIYTSQSLKDLRTTVIIEGADNLTERGLVFDSRVFTPLSAVVPVEKCDSGILEGECPDNEMQHMAVVKDYLLPQ